MTGKEITQGWRRISRTTDSHAPKISHGAPKLYTEEKTYENQINEELRVITALNLS
jgi:hypothetical protein